MTHTSYLAPAHEPLFLIRTRKDTPRSVSSHSRAPKEKRSKSDRSDFDRLDAAAPPVQPPSITADSGKSPQVTRQNPASAPMPSDGLPCTSDTPGAPTASPARPAVCQVPGCQQMATYSKLRLCRPHHSQVGRLIPGGLSSGGPTGPATGSWKGDAVGYVGAHHRVTKRHGAAALYHCACCPARALDYALLPGHGQLEDSATGYRYSSEPDDYAPMCRACHRPLDVAEGSARRNATTAPETLLPGVQWSDFVQPPVLVVMQPWKLWRFA